MTQPIKIVKREAMYIPAKGLEKKIINRITEKLTFHFYAQNGKACKECDNLPERPNDICQGCATYNGGYVLARPVIVNEKKYIKVPIGSSGSVLEYLDYNHIDFKILDKSPVTSIRPIKFIATLKPEQEKAVEALIELKRGVLKAPPRSGKTVMATAAVCKLRKKTLFLASQRDWLMGFQETFIGSKTQPAMTDLNPKRIKLCKTLEDFKTHDICMATVQTFYSEKGEKLLRAIRDMFEVIVIDEIHTGAAEKYISILSKLNTRYGIGLSGTPDRKDNRYILVENVLGKVMHEVKIESLRPRVKITRTKYTKAYKGQVPWTRMVSALENDQNRLKLIAKTAIKDVAEGHMILIPMAGLKAIKKLVSLINTMSGKRLAYPFVGGLRKDIRDETIQRARKYKIKILVGTTKILSTGINIPRASCLYEQVMSSNLPNAEQRMRRVTTVMEDKPQPVIRYFLDRMNVRRNCMRNEYFQVLMPKLKPVMGDDVRFAMQQYFNEKEGALNGRFEL